MWWKSLLAAAFASGSLVALYAAGPPLGSGQVVALAVRAEAVPLNKADPAAERVGRLRFVGGLVLTAPDRRFGGVSGMLWDADCGRLLAVTDSGAWIVLEPEEAGERLTGVKAAWIAPLLGADGLPPRSKVDADAESLAWTGAGDIWVFYELAHRGMRFSGVTPCRPETLARPPVERWVPDGVAGAPPNGGIEAAAAQGDRLLLLMELVPGPGGGRLALDAAPGRLSGRASYGAPEGFQPTAMEPRDPAGTSMLVLHRRFTPLTGVAAILAETDMPAPLKPGLEPMLESREVARLQPPLLVDNMEALAVRVEGERRYIYIASDNNFNPLQRTLLMKFELLPETP